MEWKAVGKLGLISLISFLVLAGSTFATASYFITITSNPSGYCTISGSSSGIYASGQTLSISATGSSSSYAFVSWTGSGAGSYTGTKASTTIKTDSNLDEVANCKQIATTTIPTLTVSPISPSNPTEVIGQPFTLSVGVSGGVPPYSYTWYVGTSTSCSSDTQIIATGAGSITETITASSATAEYFCVNVEDSQGTSVYTPYADYVTATSPTTVYTTTIPALAASISPQNPTSNFNTSVTFTSTVTGGVPPYNYSWSVGSSSSCASDTAILGTGSTLTDRASLSEYVCLKATDSTGTSVYAPADRFTIVTGTINTTTTTIPVLTASISPQNPTVNYNTSVTFTATVTGGVPPYSYSWSVGSSSSCASDTTVLGTGSTLTDSSSSSEYICLKATGSTGTYVYAPSDYFAILPPTTATTTTIPALTVTPISPANPTVNSGQPLILSSIASGGVPPYSYAWYVGSSSSCSSDTQVLSTESNSIVDTITTGTTSTNEYFCFRVQDSAGGSVYAPADYVTIVSPTTTACSSGCSGNTISNTVATLIVLPISPVDPIANVSQQIKFNTTAYGGARPYTYTWSVGESTNCTLDKSVIYQGNSSTIEDSSSSSEYICLMVKDAMGTSVYAPADYFTIVKPTTTITENSTTSIILPTTTISCLTGCTKNTTTTIPSNTVNTVFTTIASNSATTTTKCLSDCTGNAITTTIASYSLSNTITSAVNGFVSFIEGLFGTSTTTTTQNTTAVNESTFVVGAVTYIPINIISPYSYYTGQAPENFQQRITFDPSNSTYLTFESQDLGNIRFYKGTTELYSWCESGCSTLATNATFWVKLPNYEDVGTTVINLTFMPKSTDYDNWPYGCYGEAPQDCYAGEAPQLSSIYGEYDNGQNVFNFYDNFRSGVNDNNWDNYGDVLQASEELNMLNILTPAGESSSINGVPHPDGASLGTVQGFNSPSIFEADFASPFNSLSSSTTSIVTTSTTSTSTVSTSTSTTIPYIYIPIIITNNGAATPAPFQQMVTFNPNTYALLGEASNLGNIRFSQGSQLLDSWCESGCNSSSSDAVFWINFPQGLPTGTSVIDMGLIPNARYDGVIAGEAAQLSPVYAEYDNGANVFTLMYQNFAGASCPSSWECGGSSFSINNAAFLNDGVISPDQIIDRTGNYVFDTYAEFTNITNPSNAIAEGILFLGKLPAPSALLGFSACSIAYACSASLRVPFGQMAVESVRAEPLQPPYATVDSQLNYGAWAVGSSSSSQTSSSPPQEQIEDNGGANIRVQWARLRTYPPNGVMPLIALGSIIESPISFTGPFVTTTTSTATTTVLTSSSTSTTSTIIPLVISAISPANAIITYYQEALTLNALAIGGVPPYTYTWYVGASATCASDTAIQSGSSNSFTEQFDWGPGNYDYFCIEVHDSQATTAYSPADYISWPAATNAISSAPYKQLPAKNPPYAISLQATSGPAGAPTSTKYTYVEGASAVISGTLPTYPPVAPYSMVLMQGTNPTEINGYPTCGSSAIIVANSVYNGDGSLGSTYSFTIQMPSQPGTYYYCADPSFPGYPGESKYDWSQQSSAFTVVAPVSTPAISLSPQTVAPDGTTMALVSWSGGTAPYTVTIYEGTAPGICGFTVVSTSGSISGDTYTTTITAPSTPDTYYYCAEVSGAVSSGESSAATLVVGSTVSLTGFSFSTNPVSVSSTVTAPISWSGGVAPYSVDILSGGTSSSCGSTASASESSVGSSPLSLSFTAPSTAGTYYYCAKVEDSNDRTAISTTPIYLDVLASTSPSVSISAPGTAEESQTITVTGSWTGNWGSGSYSYYVSLLGSSTDGACDTYTVLSTVTEPSSSSSYSFQTTAPSTAGNYYYCILVVKSTNQEVWAVSSPAEVDINPSSSFSISAPSYVLPSSPITVTGTWTLNHPITSATIELTSGLTPQTCTSTVVTSTAVGPGDTAYISTTTSSSAPQVVYYCASFTSKLYTTTYPAIESPPIPVDVRINLLGTTISASPNPVITGSAINIQSSWTGDTGPYAFQVLSGGTASACGTTVVPESATSVGAAGDLEGSATVSITAPSSAGTYYYCAQATGALGSSATSPIGQVDVASPLSVPSLSIQQSGGEEGSVMSGPTSIDKGQEITISSSWTGGTGPYAVELLESQVSGDCAAYGTLVYSTQVGEAGGTSGTLQYTFGPEDLGTYYYCVEVSFANGGNGGTGYDEVSAESAPITVNPMLGVTLGAQSSQVDTGDDIILTASVSGGMPSYPVEIKMCQSATDCDNGQTMFSSTLYGTSPSLSGFVEAGAAYFEAIVGDGTGNEASSGIIHVTIVNPTTKKQTAGEYVDKAYDEQLGLTYTTDTSSLETLVQAIPQMDVDGIGPAYILNGLGSNGYWYQISINYNWPESLDPDQMQIGQVEEGFRAGVDIFNSQGQPIYNTPFTEPLSTPVNPGDLLRLKLYLVNNNVVMSIYDYNTGGMFVYENSANGATTFVGSNGGSANIGGGGAFTGLMTEWYHEYPYDLMPPYQLIAPVTYSTTPAEISSSSQPVILWADELGNGGTLFRDDGTQGTAPTLLAPISLDFIESYLKTGQAYAFTTIQDPIATSSSETGSEGSLVTSSVQQSVAAVQSQSAAQPLAASVQGALSAPSISTSPTVSEAGGQITLRSSWSGGTPPYYVYVNSVPVGSANCNLYYSQSKFGTYNTIIYQETQENNTNVTFTPVTWPSSGQVQEEFCVSVFDSGKSSVIPMNSSPSSAVTFGLGMTRPTLTVSGADSRGGLQLGQSATVSSSWSGGTGPYHVELLASGHNSTTCSIGSEMYSITVPSGGPLTLTDHITPANTTAQYYCVSVTDSLGNSVGSNATSLQDITNMRAPSFTVFPGSATIGGTVNASAWWYGGRAPYNATIYYGQSSSCSSDKSILDSADQMQNNTYIEMTPTSDGTLYYCIGVTDSSNPPVTLYSSASKLVVLVNSSVLNTTTIPQLPPWLSNSTTTTVNTTTSTTSTSTTSASTTTTPQYSAIPVIGDFIINQQQSAGDVNWFNYALRYQGYVLGYQNSDLTAQYVPYFGEFNTYAATFVANSPFSPGSTGHIIGIACGAGSTSKEVYVDDQPYGGSWNGSFGQCPATTGIRFYLGLYSSVIGNVPVSEQFQYPPSVSYNWQWARVRTYPTGGIMPSVKFGNVVGFTAILSPTNATVGRGQQVFFTAAASDGTPPYTYTWVEGASANCKSDSGVGSTGNEPEIALEFSASQYVCVMVQDSDGRLVYSAPDYVTVN